MGTDTKIEWCDHTMNFWMGCTNISPACDHCYAETLAQRFKLADWGVGRERRRTSRDNWEKPLLWNRHAAKVGTRPRVFSLSMGDWADHEVPEQWRAEMFDVIRATPHLEWLLLSKRHALVRGFLLRYAGGLENIRIGMTVENNDMAVIRLTRLRQIKEDGWPTFVSYEPALGPVDWERWLDPSRIEACIDWLIAGGESGRDARAPHPDWFRAARDACLRHAVPFHFKQWGEWSPDLGWSGQPMRRVGKNAAGAKLDGREWREFPT